MIEIRRSDDRGHADHGWLDSYHTFSFASYYDPRHTQFGPLRVLNQDRVRPGTGFGRHSHRDAEIISYVLDGVLVHQDSMGHRSVIRPGEVQLISAGRGVTHSEVNGSNDDEVHFLQMWVMPRSEGTVPRYEQRAFPEEERRGRLRLVVSPDGRDGSLVIAQDADVFAALLDRGDTAEHELLPGRAAWVQVARGRILLNGRTLGSGDGAAVRGERTLLFEGEEEAEIVLFDLPAVAPAGAGI